MSRSAGQQKKERIRGLAALPIGDTHELLARLVHRSLLVPLGPAGPGRPGRVDESTARA